MRECKPIEKIVNAEQLFYCTHEKGSNRHLHNLSCAHILVKYVSHTRSRKQLRRWHK